MTRNFSKLNPKKYILIKGAQLHNLKNIDVAIPRNKLVVITGLSGSGKSSLAFDTLYAEGQRRYVESLSAYARQFLGKLNKPKVTYIKGIAPAIAIEQKVSTNNPRSTVGTSTEIYDYLKLLFARIGRTYSPISHKEVKKHTVTDVIDDLKTLPENTKMYVLAPVDFEADKACKIVLKLLAQQGYARLKVNGEVCRLENDFIERMAPEKLLKAAQKNQVHLVVDRIVVKHDPAFYNRLADSIETAFFEGKGTCLLENIDQNMSTTYSNKFERDGMTFLEPSTHLFSFNNPYGACPSCEGYGSTLGIDRDLVIPNTGLSLYEDAIIPWKSASFQKYKEELIDHAYLYDIPIHKPWFELSDAQKKQVWKGNKDFRGIDGFFKYLERKNYKIQYRVMLSRYRGRTQCCACEGKRLRKEANYVKIGNHSISDLVDLPIKRLSTFFSKLSLNSQEAKIAKRILHEIKSRLTFLEDVGLDYLSLNRASNTLSGGESQRINLATSLGSSLVGSMYILDEPSIGLHPKDTKRLIKVLKKLRDLGNTVIVVEHDEDLMKEADFIIDIGPEAGKLGGSVVAQGNFKEILTSDTLTANYLNQKLTIDPPQKRRTSKNTLAIKGARENNLKNTDVEFPLNTLTVVTGVSGSGKSTLVNDILYPALLKKIKGIGKKPGAHTALTGNFSNLKNVTFIDQNPIGRSSRSNPVTYVKAYDEIRNLFASMQLAKVRNYKAKHFSFNVDGGRCETCKGEGVVTIEMQFMADVHLTCEVCKGKRFKKEVLEVKFHDKTIDDILRMTVAEALAFFKKYELSKIVQKLMPLSEVGLDYVQLGQSSSTLSGGEAQRIKLASFLSKGTREEKTLFIFDEPTTGLHFHDIKKLINSLEALIQNGHSILVIEHNLDFIKCADYVIDLGPEGGEKGGSLLFQGTPEDMLLAEKSVTAKFLEQKIKTRKYQTTSSSLEPLS